MPLFSRIFGGGQEETEDEEEISLEGIEIPPCPHTMLAARWDTNEDLGIKEKVSGYSCTTCGVLFSREEAQPYLNY